MTEPSARAASDAHEEVFRLLAESISHFAWIADGEGKIYWFNQRWFDYTGTTLEEMMDGRGQDKVAHPDHRERVAEKYRRSLAAGEPWEDVFPLRGRDGGYRWFLSRAMPIRDGAGRITRWFGTNTDITRQREAEAELKAAKEAAEAARAHLHALFMQAPAPICILRGPGHQFELANPLFLQLVGPGDVVGRGVAEVMPEAAARGLLGLLDRVYATGERHTGREVPMHFDGRGTGRPETWVMNFVYEPFREADGAIAGILVIAFDVSDVVRAREAIERANVARDQFLAAVSHELRTPLNSILGWAALLRAADAPRDLVAKGVETIERNARAQAQLIEDLLDVSRVQVGKLKLEPSAVFVPAVCEAALDAARPAADAKGIRLEADVDPDAGSIIADPVRLQQVIWNLVSNAVKFTPPGGSVRLSAGREGGELVLAVRDTGRGIEPEFLPLVFEKFQQAQPSSRKTGGLGLGLSIVRSLVELHGGTVGAESEGAGKGACFTVRLPIRASFRPGTARGDEDGSMPPAPPSEPLRALEGVRLLVVDDQEDARELLAAILADAGASVRSASSADEALALFREERPDALVSDLGMPGKDGYALIRELRALPGGRRVPALALTAYARSEDRVRALAAGFTLHVAKPVEPTELVLALARTLGRDVHAPG